MLKSCTLTFGQKALPKTVAEQLIGWLLTRCSGVGVHGTLTVQSPIFSFKMNSQVKMALTMKAVSRFLKWVCGWLLVTMTSSVFGAQSRCVDKCWCLMLGLKGFTLFHPDGRSKLLCSCCCSDAWVNPTCLKMKVHLPLKTVCISWQDRLVIPLAQLAEVVRRPTRVEVCSRFHPTGEVLLVTSLLP